MEVDNLKNKQTFPFFTFLIMRKVIDPPNAKQKDHGELSGRAPSWKGAYM